ncbi:MAG TPA: hypothetical protein VNB90_02640 [Cytophagaceae bacterium]|nr:hypothetical protein [Cytophagaceae bacterium]
MKKKSMLLMAAAVVMSVAFSSCNKKLKDDIKDLDNQVADLKSQQATTNSNLSATNSTLDATNSTLKFYPFSMTVSTKNDNDSAMTISRTYKFNTGPDYSNITNNHDGTYSVYLYVTESAYWDNDAYMGFTYNPTTKVVTNGSFDLNYYDYQYNYKNVRLYQSDADATVTVTVNTFDTTTGAVDISVNGTTTTASSYNIYSGKAMTASFHYTGTLTVFQ